MSDVFPIAAYRPQASVSGRRLLDLPIELLEDIVQQVSRQSLKNLALTCVRLYPLAAGQIWHTVEMKDACSQRLDPERHAYQPDGAPENDLDGETLPGMPLRWGTAALADDNPRRAAGPPAAADAPGGAGAAAPNNEPHPLNPRGIANHHRRERDEKYSRLDVCANGLGLDQHDDTPMIRKLYLLATRPDLAAHVRVVWHRCHLVTPDMSTELIWISCNGQTLSSDYRTIFLLRLAIRNMVNVTTLRFLMPHWNIYWTMMCDFLDRTRRRNRPISRLWLETCSVASDVDLWPPQCDFSTVKSLRFRRLKMSEDAQDVHLNQSQLYPSFYLSRTGPPVRIRNGNGGMYFTSTHTVEQENTCRPNSQAAGRRVVPDKEHGSGCAAARALDDYVYAQMPEITTFLTQIEASAGSMSSLLGNHQKSDTVSNRQHREQMARWIGSKFQHLTHLNLDWLILRKPQRSYEFTMALIQSDTSERFLFAELSRIRIRTLRSFQMRNALSLNSILPPEIFLLHPTTFRDNSTGDELHHVDFLSFIEAHPDLTSLSWPMDAFLRDRLWDEGDPITETQMYLARLTARVRAVIRRFSQSLQSLRVDAMFHHQGEPHSDTLQAGDAHQRDCCSRRRLFISVFASQLQKVHTLKIEGYVPRDEKREILKAMKLCPLQRFVCIGRTFPLGNTWGANAIELETIEGLAWQNTFADNFEAESLLPLHAVESLPLSSSLTIMNDTVMDLSGVSDDGHFVPRWGWQEWEAPLLYTVACCFADSITELKFCGTASSIVYGQTYVERGSVTDTVLCHLKHFRNLKSLIISYYSPRDTRFEEEDIILTWLCERDALWHGRDETFEDEERRAETDWVEWHDLARGHASPNDPGRVDHEKLAKVIKEYADINVVQQALRRAYLWEKQWSLHPCVSPFPAFPDFGIYEEDQWQKDPVMIKFGNNIEHLESRNGFGAEVNDPLDRSEKITINTVTPFAKGEAPPWPGEVFAPFEQSHYFLQWFNSPFLMAPVEPEQVVFFWKHVAAMLQLLRYRFSPIRMSEQIYKELSWLLAPAALASGVKVRASFCMGTESNDIFDLDILMDGNGVRRFWGPRPEADWGRWREKNDAREFF